MSDILDIHTHHTDGAPGEAIISMDVRFFTPQPGYWYSVGIHPWEVLKVQEGDMASLLEHVSHPQVLAIGETGFDRLRVPDMQAQFELMKQHVMQAEVAVKPLIIHMVKAADMVLKARKMLGARGTWIIHGFRGKPQEAEQLLKAGLYLSFGEHYNVDTLRATPLDRLFLETDEATCGIQFIYNKVAADLEMDVETLKEEVKKNIDRIFFKKK